MDARVPRRPAELHGLAVAQRAQRPELRAELRIVRQRRDGAVDVELRVPARVAAVLHGEADQLVARHVHRLAPRLQELAALRERQLARGRAALRPAELHRFSEIDPVARSAGERSFRRGVHQGRERLLPFDPASSDEASQRLHGASCSGSNVSPAEPPDAATSPASRPARTRPRRWPRRSWRDSPDRSCPAYRRRCGGCRSSA